MVNREQLAQKIEFLAGDKVADNRCGECGELWDSEYHMSDECVNVDEDMELKADLYRKYGSG